MMSITQITLLHIYSVIICWCFPNAITRRRKKNNKRRIIMVHSIPIDVVYLEHLSLVPVEWFHNKVSMNKLLFERSAIAHARIRCEFYSILGKKSICVQAFLLYISTTINVEIAFGWWGNEASTPRYINTIYYIFDNDHIYIYIYRVGTRTCAVSHPVKVPFHSALLV